MTKFKLEFGSMVGKYDGDTFAPSRKCAYIWVFKDEAGDFWATDEHKPHQNQREGKREHARQIDFWVCCECNNSVPYCKCKKEAKP